MKKLKEIKEKMDALYATISKDSTLQVEKSNQSAAIRARKASVELEKLFKEFRKVSIKLSKEQTGKSNL